MKYLITGGAGFIGSSLAEYLLKKDSDNQIIIIDDLSMGDINNIPNSSNVQFIQDSVTNQELLVQLFKKENFDYIYHFAAVASVADSVERPVETHKVNFDSTFYLLECARQYQPNLKRFVFASSAAVYGDEPTLPKKEESIIRPLTPYAVDKFASERYALNYANLYNVPCSATRFFNVFGPKQNPSSPYSGVISILVDRYKKLIKNEKNVTFTLFGDGEQSRDFVYIEDVLNALYLVGHSKESFGEVYNVGTGNNITLNELIKAMNKILNQNLPVNYSQTRDGDIKDSYADISKIKNLGYKPMYSLDEGLKKYLSSVLKK